MFLRLLQVLLFFLLLNSFETKANNSPFFNLKDFGIENTDNTTPIIVETLARSKEEGISILEFSESPNLKIINWRRGKIGNNIYNISDKHKKKS